MDAPLKSVPIRLDIIKRRAVQIYEDANACGRAYSRDVAIAALLPSLEWAKAHAIPAELAHTIVIDAWVAEGRKRILNWDVRSVGTLIDLFPECVPSRCRTRAMTADQDDADTHWRVRFLMDQPRQNNLVNGPVTLDKYLCERGTATVVAAHVDERMRAARAEIDARKAAEPPPLPAFAYTPQAAQEHLLATWLDTEPSQDVKRDWRGPYWETATVEGTTLYTRPGQVMERSASFLPYEETDGVLYQFVREGKRISGFRPDRAGDGHVMASGFAYFAEKYAIHIPPDSWTHCACENDGASETKRDRPRP